MIPDYMHRVVDDAFPSEATSVGFVGMNPARDFLLIEPKDHYGGVSATFPKVRLNSGERPAEALVRCITEKIGYPAFSVYPVPGVWETQNSKTKFFAGLIREWGYQGEDPEPPSPFVQKATWCPAGLAHARIGESPNGASRDRDLELLDVASSISLYPGRAVLLMVGALHRLGFERLRGVPYMSPSGAFWRCEVVPSTCVSSKHGAFPISGMEFRLEEQVANPGVVFRYSDGQGQQYFGWTDAAFDTPEQLAEKFLQRSREIGFAGWGADNEYARWYTEMLSLTAPTGVPYAFSDSEPPREHLYTMLTWASRQVPLPPPGLAPLSEDDEWIQP